MRDGRLSELLPTLHLLYSGAFYSKHIFHFFLVHIRKECDSESIKANNSSYKWVFILASVQASRVLRCCGEAGGVLGVDTQNIFTQAGGHLARPGRPAEMFYAVMDFAISCGGQRSNLSLLPAEYFVLFLFDVRIL